MYFYDSEPKHPHLPINSSRLYYTNEEVTYSTKSNFANIDMPLLVGVNGYSGSGEFHINYCDGMLKASFENKHGENGEVGITAVERQACKTIRQDNKHSSEPLKVKVKNVEYEFGYEVQLYEGYIQQELRINQEKYGIFFSSEDSRTYSIHLPPSLDQPVLIEHRELGEKERHLLFEVKQCNGQGKECEVVSSSKDNLDSDLTFTPDNTHTYQLVVSYATVTTKLIEFEITMRRSTIQSELIEPGKLYTDEIEENEYQFYAINLTQVEINQNMTIPNLSSLEIQVK